MTPLEAVKKMAADPPITFTNDGDPVCAFCLLWKVHKDDCPVPMLPKIVAALEAAQALVGTELRVSGTRIDPELLQAAKWNAVVQALKG